MKVISIVLFASMLLLVGCSSYITVSPQPEYNKITVTGQASFETMPDLAVFNVQVESEGKTAAEASSLAAEGIKSVKDALISAGIKSSDIETISYNVYPWKRWEPKTGREILEGYKAYHTLKIESGGLEKTGEYLDKAIKAGATNIDSIRFTFSKAKQKEINDEALRLAVANAREKAKTVAEVAGLGLGKAISISESNFYSEPYYPPYPVRVFEGDAMEKAETDISPQKMKISAIVQVAYLIE